MNKVILIGNLTRDPEMNGSACKMSLATNEYSKDNKQVSEFHRLVAFKKTAEICMNHLSKGSKMALEGRLKTNQWEDKEGNKRYTTEIIVDRMEFVGGKANGGGTTTKKEEAPTVGAGSDDSLPF